MEGRAISVIGLRGFTYLWVNALGNHGRTNLVRGIEYASTCKKMEHFVLGKLAKLFSD